MTRRTRKTWASRNRTASPPPATPQGTGDHPADQGDPAYDAYAKGDTSSWAEDPHPPPYPDSAPPATPQGSGDHPAEKRASDLRRRYERKAAKCIRVATAMLGRTASVSKIESQALDLMDLPDRAIHAALKRISTNDQDEDAEDDYEDGKEASRRRFAEDDEEDEDEALLASMLRDAETDHQADDRFALLQSQIAELRDLIAQGQNDPDTYEGPEPAPVEIMEEAEEYAEDGVEAMLQEMLAEEEAVVEEAEVDTEAEAMLARMLAEEEAVVEEAEVDTEAEAMLAEMVKEMDAEAEVVEPEPAPETAGCGQPMATEDPVLGEDPMGLMDVAMDDGDTDLMSLYAKEEGDDKDESAEEKEEDEEDAEAEAAETVQEEVEEEAKEKAEKKASRQRPQARKPSSGVKSLGGLSKQASGGGELGELSKLWDSAPDVSSAFE